MLITLYKFPYRYFPYEEEFLNDEARSIGEILNPTPTTVTVRVRGYAPSERLNDRLARLTYFSHFTWENSERRPTHQFLLENGTSGSPGGSRRQSTRYSVHGIHEYKGRFNPQIARFLMNVSGISSDGVVFDPFCGCGTVLVEAVHYGCRAIGIDSNPLAELLTKAKLALLGAKTREIDEFAGSLKSILKYVERSRLDFDLEDAASKLGLSIRARQYLDSWFPRNALAKLLAFRILARKTLRRPWVVVAEALVSNVARDVSYQDPADLRIRRRKQAPENTFLEGPIDDALESLILQVRNANAVINKKGRGVARVFCADSRQSVKVVRQAVREYGRRTVDVVVTSPPYATALPYIDTSRLSLILLGLGEPCYLRRLERLQIGSRELSPSERNGLEAEIDEELSSLPHELSSFIRTLLRNVRDHEVGFRKRNVPALLATYFSAIKQVLSETRKVLKPQGQAFWVVGKNRTETDKKWIEIDTPKWIAAIGKSIGFEVDVRGLDTYQRFGLHHRNAIRNESLLTFRAV